MLQRKYLALLSAFLLALSLSACPKKQVKKTAEEPPKQEEPEGELESDELDIRGKEFVSLPELKTIQFAYDSSDLTEEARNILAANAGYLNKHPDLDVLVEGHCDERGTIGYNLALGQKRAGAVRKYYLSLGIKPGKSAALSYGKEKPLCPQTNEECWQKNRRAETKVVKAGAGVPSRERQGPDDSKKGMAEEESKP